MNKVTAIVIGLGIVGALILTCKVDHGLAPINEDTGLTGTITFVGAWPDTLDILDLSALGLGKLFGVVANPDYLSPDSLTLNEVIDIYLNHPARLELLDYDSLYELLPDNPDTVEINYRIAPLETGTYEWVFFLIVPSDFDFATEADSLGKYLFATYYEFGDSTGPGSVEVTDERLTKDVDMTVNLEDFSMKDDKK